MLMNICSYVNETYQVLWDSAKTVLRGQKNVVSLNGRALSILPTDVPLHPPYRCAIASSLSVF